MKTFDFTVDRKYTMWEKEYHRVEAKTFKEAKE